MMKKMLLAGAALLVLSACSTQKSENAALEASSASNAVEAASDAATGSEAGAPPKIDASVAPGVAFDFDYRFSLPEAKIAEAQEGHARLCGALGVSRCRVTGVEFSKERGGDVSASMSFKLDPALALSFGRDATELVERADGKLETSNVQGTDAGTAIVEGDRTADQLRADLKRIEVQLALPKLSSQVRQELLSEARNLRNRLSEIKADRNDKVDSLATTPVSFAYEPSDTVMGFERGSAAQTGLAAGAASLSAVTTILAFALGAFGPWIALAGLGVWLWRRTRKPKTAAPEA